MVTYPSLDESKKVFKNEVIIQEKIDGSQFRFFINENNELECHSKNCKIDLQNPPKQFKKAVEYCVKIEELLDSNLVYFGEVLDKPKHNTLEYERIPKNNIMIFDIYDKKEHRFFNALNFTNHVENELDLEIVWTLSIVGNLKSDRVDIYSVKTFINDKLIPTTKSGLGGKIEGVVAKCYETQSFVKFVSKEFKELHSKRSCNKLNKDVKNPIVGITNKYRTTARWNKAIQHLRDDGQLTETPKDIGPLLKEISLDVLKECKEQIKEDLFEVYWKELSKGITEGFPDYYKTYLEGDVWNQEKI